MKKKTQTRLKKLQIFSFPGQFLKKKNINEIIEKKTQTQAENFWIFASPDKLIPGLKKSIIFSLNISCVGNESLV